MFDGRPVDLTPKAFDVLAVLVESDGKLVEKDELMAKVWPESFVEESNLTFNIRQLRKLLNDDAQDPTYIKTVPRHGYRFISPVTKATNATEMEQVLNNGGLSGNFPARVATDRSRPVFRTKYLAFAAGVLVFGIALYLLLPSLIGRFGVTSPSFRDLSFEQVVKSDKYTTASISPNGKYFAYVNTVNGEQSLWLRQLASGQSMEIVPAEDGVSIQRVKISSDGEFVYFSRKSGAETAHLDRVPIFGGLVQANVAWGPNTQFDISADASLVVFPKTTDSKTSLVLERTGGGEAKNLFETEDAVTGTSFSPDARTVAFASGVLVSGSQKFGVYTIDVDGGTPVPATDQRWNYVRDVLWLPDGSGLLVTASSAANSPRQLWKINLADGKAERAYETQNSLDHLSITQDQQQLLISGDSLSSKLYSAPMADVDSARPIAPGYLGVSWIPGGHIVYSAFNGNDDIWCVSPDGTTQMQLTTESSMDFRPTVTPDGKYIVFISDRGGTMNIWRMNTDGSNQIQLTRGNGESFPSLAPDGSYVVFNSNDDGKYWRVPIDGGDVSPMPFDAKDKVAISPDGTSFAHFAGKAHEKKLVLEGLDRKQVMREFDLPPGLFAGHDLIWSRDGKALHYVAREKKGASNIWAQPVDGSPPRKITNYNSEGILYFDFSPDYQQIAFTRGAWSYEIILAKVS